jgi:hypothetical protein
LKSFEIPAMSLTGTRTATIEVNAKMNSFKEVKAMALQIPDHLILFARQVRQYTFGSLELEALHRRLREYGGGRYTKSHWYVVRYVGATPEDSFHTLNHAQAGQTCSVTYDLPKGWRGGSA